MRLRFGFVLFFNLLKVFTVLSTLSVNVLIDNCISYYAWMPRGGDIIAHLLNCIDLRQTETAVFSIPLHYLFLEDHITKDY